MPRMLSIAAALATVLTVAACSSAAASADGAQGTGGERAASAAESAGHARPAPESGASQSRASQSSASQTSQGAQDSALRTGTLSVAATLDAGESGLPAQSGASMDDVLRLGAVATWIDAPDTLAISLPAGEDCWPSATEPVVESATRLSIEFVAGECTDLSSARTYTVEVPDGIETGEPLELRIGGLEHPFTLTLPRA